MSVDGARLIICTPRRHHLNTAVRFLSPHSTLCELRVNSGGTTFREVVTLFIAKVTEAESAG